MKLHNIKLFDNALKLGWLKRYIRSTSKRTTFPKHFELERVFTYGQDYIDSIEAMATNKFWLNVLDSFKFLWKSNCILDEATIMETPIWLNPSFGLHIRRKWKEKGIMVVSDFVDYLKKPYSMEEFISKYEVKKNFLAYAKVTLLIIDYLDWRDISHFQNFKLRNSFLNTILSNDVEGVSNLYTLIHPKGNQILGE